MMENETIQPNPVNESPKYNPISVGECVIITIVFAIPIVVIHYVIYLGLW